MTAITDSYGRRLTDHLGRVLMVAQDDAPPSPGVPIATAGGGITRLGPSEGRSR